MTKKKILAKLEAEAPFNLYYVDYRDSLAEHPDKINEILANGYVEEFSQEITDFIYENDESDPEKDLVRNTGDRLFMVDLNYHFSDLDYVNEDDRKLEAKEFLKKIGAEESEKNINKVIALRGNAPYGGTAYAMLYTGLSDFYLEKKQSIILDDIVLAIINTSNGSWWYMDDGSYIDCDITVSRNNIFDDYSIHYGLQEIFWDTPELCSSYNFTDSKWTIEEWETAKSIENEKKWAEQYAKTGCAGYGCPKYKYHTTEYRNDIPAGSKCIHCGRFYID